MRVACKRKPFIRTHSGSPRYNHGRSLFLKGVGHIANRIWQAQEELLAEQADQNLGGSQEVLRNLRRGRLESEVPPKQEDTPGK